MPYLDAVWSVNALRSTGAHNVLATIPAVAPIYGAQRQGLLVSSFFVCLSVCPSVRLSVSVSLRARKRIIAKEKLLVLAHSYALGMSRKRKGSQRGEER